LKNTKKTKGRKAERAKEEQATGDRRSDEYREKVIQEEYYLKTGAFPL